MVVCRTGKKGFGVMSTANIPKGLFVCSYVGEEVSETYLQNRETHKENFAEEPSGYRTYAFEIHQGTKSINIDSECVHINFSFAYIFIFIYV
jgi:hypothetical protein